jgi:hypothetical protein
MDKNSLEWAELEDLAGRISDLRSRHRARTAIGGGALTAIKREIEECEVQRQRLVNRLSEHLATGIVDSLALPA